MLRIRQDSEYTSIGSEPGTSLVIKDEGPKLFDVFSLSLAGVKPCYIKSGEQKSENNNKQTKSVALVRKRTIPTERPPHVGEVSANFCG
jgi:hypothetical protein